MHRYRKEKEEALEREMKIAEEQLWSQMENARSIEWTDFSYGVTKKSSGFILCISINFSSPSLKKV